VQGISTCWSFGLGGPVPRGNQRPWSHSQREQSNLLWRAASSLSSKTRMAWKQLNILVPSSSTCRLPAWVECSKTLNCPQQHQSNHDGSSLLNLHWRPTRYWKTQSRPKYPSLHCLKKHFELRSDCAALFCTLQTASSPEIIIRKKRSHSAINSKPLPWSFRPIFPTRLQKFLGFKKGRLASS